jgi:serine/threonine protein kinase
MPLSSGTRLGPYEIVAALGSGGMGEVYRGRDTRLDRVVAIKILPEHISGRPLARERFEREARAVSSLNHPHICTLHDIGHQDGINYLVMEYLEGETLAHRLKKGPLSPEQVLQCAIQITDALDTAHRHGVIHRDLKPGNIMLTKSGAKLLDFGLAKVRAGNSVARMAELPTETMTLTGERTVLGTLQYMAPEQLEGSEARTDIFALGAVIYEMATGRKAFEGKSHADVIAAILEREPQPISTIQAMAPPALDLIVRTCLAKQCGDRWQTAHDVGWIVALCSSAAMIAAGAIAYLRPAPEERLVQFEVATTPLPATQIYFAPLISPDGRYVAYLRWGDLYTANPGMIFLYSLNAMVTNALPGTEGAGDYAWSADSRQIAFSTDSALKRVNIAGGTPEIICNQPASAIAWSRDDVILFSHGLNQPLFRVAAAAVTRNL